LLIQSPLLVTKLVKNTESFANFPTVTKGLQFAMSIINDENKKSKVEKVLENHLKKVWLNEAKKVDAKRKTALGKYYRGYSKKDPTSIFIGSALN
tara:strand:+ start:138 stop:422 length:285 start_codon:yes stop_codon:yes gene_type:complete